MRLHMQRGKRMQTQPNDVPVEAEINQKKSLETNPTTTNLNLKTNNHLEHALKQDV